MKWELKRKPLSKRKTETARNPWSQPGWWVWVSIYGGKDFWKRYVFSLERKSEGVMDDDSGDSEENEGEEDWFRQGTIIHCTVLHLCVCFILYFTCMELRLVSFLLNEYVMLCVTYRYTTVTIIIIVHTKSRPPIWREHEPVLPLLPCRRWNFAVFDTDVS